MIDFYKFYREYYGHKTLNGVGRRPTPHAVPIVEQLRKDGNKSWFITPMKVFKDLLTKNGVYKVRDYHDIERIHEMYPNEVANGIANDYIIYALAGLSVAVAEYLPVYLNDSCEIIKAINRRHRTAHKYTKDNSKLSKYMVKKLYDAIDTLTIVHKNNDWSNISDIAVKAYIANICVFINHFAAVYKISSCDFQEACRLHMKNDFMQYVLKGLD